MKLFKITAVFLTLCLILTGCSLMKNSWEKQEAVFEIPLYGLTLTAYDTYRVDAENSSWDLQITDGNAYISVMAYKYIDLSEEQTPEAIYDYHNSDIFSRRDNVKVIEEAAATREESRTITKTRYSAELDGTKNYYDSFLVDFRGNEVFAWVLVTGTPSYVENSKELSDIVYSLKIAK